MAARLAEAGVEDAQVVVDFGHSTDGRAPALARGLLLDADGRRQAADMFDLRLLHLPEELPGVGGQRLDVAALPFGIDRVECQRTLARAARSAAHGHLFAWHGDADVLQVVLLGALDRELRQTGRAVG